MKKIFGLITLFSILSLSTACEFWDNIKKESSEAVENVEKEAAEVKGVYDDTVEAIESVGAAVEATEKAVEDVKSIGE